MNLEPQVPELKLQCVRDVEDVLKGLCQSFTFKVRLCRPLYSGHLGCHIASECLCTVQLQDAPRFFHERMERVMEQWIFINDGKDKGVLGRINNYLIRYEV